MAQFPRFIDINSTSITNRRQLCQEFNKYFINVANNLNTDKYQDTPPPDHSCYLKNSVQSFTLSIVTFTEINKTSGLFGKQEYFPHIQLFIVLQSSIFLSSIEEEEVSDIIHKLDNQKSNNISPKLLKPLSGTFSRTLTYFFNLCMAASVFPDELKIGKIIPLYKSGNKSVMSNYRPISILPTISKIFEKLLHNAYTNFSKKIMLYMIINLVLEKNIRPFMRFKPQ